MLKLSRFQKTPINTRLYHSVFDTLQYLPFSFTMANRWSMEEEYLLATVWLEVHDSEDLVNERSFWNEVTQRFNNQSDGQHRNKNSIMAQ